MSHYAGQPVKAITVTLCESFDSVILPFQLIYIGKTERSLPNVDFPQGFCFAFIEKHWSNETETIRLINDILRLSTLKPYHLKPYHAKVMTDL